MRKHKPKIKDNPKTINERFLSCMWDIIQFHRDNECLLTSVTAFGATLGLNKASFDRYYNSHYNVPSKSLEKACRIHRMNPTYIILGEGKKFLDESYKTNAIENKIASDQKEIQERIKRLDELKKKKRTEKFDAF